MDLSAPPARESMKPETPFFIIHPAIELAFSISYQAGPTLSAGRKKHFAKPLAVAVMVPSSQRPLPRPVGLAISKSIRQHIDPIGQGLSASSAGRVSEGGKVCRTTILCLRPISAGSDVVKSQLPVLLCPEHRAQSAAQLLPGIGPGTTANGLHRRTLAPAAWE